MSRGSASGYSLSKEDAKVVLAMAERGDRNHDIAAWFGVNQGRIAEAKAGEYGTLEMAPADQLPPQGAPGIKGRRLRDAVGLAIDYLGEGQADQALARLNDAIEQYDANEG